MKMKRDQRLAQVSKLMQKFMDRAEVNDTELARRIGLSRNSVIRLRVGESLPKEETILRLKTGLRWVDSTGMVRELTDDELTQLRNAAGYHEAQSHSEVDRVERTDRCIVYSNRYSRDAFPSKWSKRIMELERSVTGSISTMWNTFPSITRSPSFYVGAYKEGLYQQEKAEAHMAAHEARQEEFFKRLVVSGVRHLYSKRGVENFIRGLSTGGRPDWAQWPLPGYVLAKQLDNILEWLDKYENFEVRLREKDLPGNVTVLGHDIVLIEFSLASSLRTGDYLNGLELVGAATSAQFLKQFDSFWADRQTVKDRHEVIRWFKQLQSSYT